VTDVLGYELRHSGLEPESILLLIVSVEKKMDPGSSPGRRTFWGDVVRHSGLEPESILLLIVSVEKKMDPGSSPG